MFNNKFNTFSLPYYLLVKLKQIMVTWGSYSRNKKYLIIFLSMTEIEQRKQQRQAECDEMTMAKKQLKMKLDVLSNIHAKRDVKVRQDLAREQEMRANLEGEYFQKNWKK